MSALPLELPQVLIHFLNLMIAFVLALPAGWNREQHERSAGLRTFSLVAVASCGYILLAERAFEGSVDAQARVLEGLITGIGFIGGGAILKEGASVRGTATAASIWSMGGVGASVAYERYEIAIVLSLINFATLRFLSPLERGMNRDEEGKET